MLGPLAFLFVVVPFVELYILIRVGQWIGAVPTIVALIAVSVLGATLVKREGLGVLRRAQARVDAGEVPGVELIDGVLILFAGALLLTPGFMTDVFGVLLLLPPFRAAIRGRTRRYLTRRATFGIRRYR